jgi:hypothetical protein
VQLPDDRFAHDGRLMTMAEALAVLMEKVGRMPVVGQPGKPCAAS